MTSAGGVVASSEGVDEHPAEIARAVKRPMRWKDRMVSPKIINLVNVNRAESILLVSKNGALAEVKFSLRKWAENAPHSYLRLLSGESRS